MTRLGETRASSEPTSPSPEQRSAIPWPLRFLAATCVAVLLVAVAAHTAASLASESSRVATYLPVALLLAAGMGLVALVRIEAFILAVLLIRSSLDALKLGTGTAGTDPAALIGLLFLAVVPLWLILNYRDRPAGLRPISGTGIAVLAFVGAASLGVLTSTNMLDSAVEFSRIATSAVMFFAVERLAQDRAFRPKVLVVIGISALVPMAMAAFQLATNSGLFNAGGFDRVTGTFTHSNPFAAYLAVLIIMGVALVAVLRTRYRWWALGLVTLMAPWLLLTYTRAAWLAAVVGVITVLVVTRHKRLLAGAVAAILAVVLLVPSVGDRFADVDPSSEEAAPTATNSLEWRFEYWNEALELQEAPVTGIGLKSVARSLPEGKQPHNDLVRAYVELGIVGLVALVALIAAMIRLGLQGSAALRRAGGRLRSLDFAVVAGFSGVAVAYATMSLVANLMSQAVVVLYVMALAGLASAVTREVTELEPASEPSALEAASA